MRVLGRSGIEVSDIGLGTWAMGGPYTEAGEPCGWGLVDDHESIRAIRQALDSGVNLIDTADVYGAGHAEAVVGTAIAGCREAVVIATKWGSIFSERTKEVTGSSGAASHLHRALRASLRRLRTDYVDVLQLHVNDLPLGQALDLVPHLDDLVDRGFIRAYGWSTDFADRAEPFVQSSRASVLQHEMSVLHDSPVFVAISEVCGLGLLCRAPLAMGLITDKVDRDFKVASDDIRSRNLPWMAWFADGKPVPREMERRARVAHILRRGGRTLAQGALAWVLARSRAAVPLVGMRTCDHVAENAKVLEQGPLDDAQTREIDTLLRHHWRPEAPRPSS